MNVSVRSYLMAGAVAATATAVALTPVQVMPADIAVPAQPSTVEPQLSQAMVDLLAAAGRMTAALPTTPLRPSGADPATGTAPAAAVTASPAAVAIAPNLANTIDNAYLAIEPWVQYGFEVAAAVLAWVPWVGGVSGLVMDAYTFGESLVASAVFNFTDWLRGDGGIISNVVDFGVDVGLAFVWLGLDVVNTFIPLPPIPLPPRPPVQGPFVAANLLATPATAAIGDLVQNPIDTVTGTLTTVREDFVEAVEDLTDGTVLADRVDPLEAVVTAVTPDEPAQQDAVTDIPTSVRQWLKPRDKAAGETASPDGLAPRALAKDVRDSTRKVAATVRADVKKAAENMRDNVRNAVKDVRKGLTGSDAKKPSENSTNGKADTAKPAKPTKPAKTDKKDKAAKKATTEAKD
ncbi:hypothetical protein M1247_05410 [Mycobacterium sp. 21AC1]|uniref:hypothetical protein n=1 Tax=[Mycobacterium] appelbergii TaxID=2939269 RepID=UPI0029390E18|nr:hypothetical protein [Mycobacterium sp. 21AC1]MDV3124340.1 hypothetical protein [Mycobacterium sp. 21AC1]